LESEVVAPADGVEASWPDVGTTEDAAGLPDVAGCSCGDGTCDPACGETLANCPFDCKVCGDEVCSPGEGPVVCPVDCCGGCGDGKCRGYQCGEDPAACPKDCGTPCGDGTCQQGENPLSCPSDCGHDVCGNGVCEPSDGGPAACPQDCGTTCGNCECEKGEDWLTCPVDCGWCGDGVCSPCPALKEGLSTCPKDCGIVPDPVPDTWEPGDAVEPDVAIDGEVPDATDAGDAADAAGPDDAEVTPATEFAGVVESSTTWTGVMLLTGDVVVPVGVVLTVGPGTLVLVEKTDGAPAAAGYDSSRVEVIVFGRMDVSGTDGAPVVFRSAAAGEAALDWYGISVRALGEMAMDYAEVSGAYTAVSVDSGAIEGAIRNTLVQTSASGISGCPTALDDIEITGTLASWYPLDRTCSKNLVSSRVSIHHCPRGAHIRHVGSVTLKDWTVQSIGGACVVVSGVGDLAMDGLSVSGCQDEGISVSGTTTATVRNAVITGCQAAAVFIADPGAGGALVVDSDLRKNSIGVRVAGAGGEVRVTRTNIVQNAQDAVAESGADLDAHGNWWGDPGAPGATAHDMADGPYPKDVDRILDRFDESGRGFVRYGQWLDQPVDPGKENFVVTIVSPDGWLPVRPDVHLEAAVPAGAGVHDSGVSWSSDVQGPLGTGPSLDVTGLSAGWHLITVSATTPGGASDSSSVYVEVRDGLTSVGTLSKSETWSGVVGLVGDVLVPVGSKLTVQPGTEVVPLDMDMTGGGADRDRTPLIVEGNLAVAGTEADPVTLGNGATASSWYGVRVRPVGVMKVDRAAIAGAYRAFDIDDKRIAADITNVSVRDGTYGVSGCPTRLDDNKFEDMSGSAVSVTGCTIPVTYYRNRISSCGSGAAVSGGFSATLVGWTVEYVATGDGVNGWNAQIAIEGGNFSLCQGAGIRVSNAYPSVSIRNVSVYDNTSGIV
ncbi:MAG: right-handed parallel beta-helix repeat-containing protein, partial [Deltaproteobacteria bacterium]|nr:right-handed parallel beta-helix repeat-containing protein [Deltaproteobacteria bacterium]